MARQHFFFRVGIGDPFGQDATVDFDAPHDLLMVENQRCSGQPCDGEANDYACWQPRLLSDPNRNQIAVALDVLGMVPGTAVMASPCQQQWRATLLAGFVLI